MYSPIPEESPKVQATWANRYTPSAGKMLKRGIRQGFEMSTLGIMGTVAEHNRLRGVGDLMNEEEWAQSEFFRDGLTYEKGMTDGLAQLLADRHDRNSLDSFLANRSTKGGMAAMIAGNFIGSIPDPLNFIPFLGFEAAAGRATSLLGKTGGRVALTSADAVVGAAAMQPLIAYEHSLYQDPWDYTMAVRDVTFAAAIGAGFGGIGVALSRFSPRERVASMSKAVNDIMRNEPVDVSPVLQSPVAALRRIKGISAKIRSAPGDAPTEIIEGLGMLSSQLEGHTKAGVLLDALTREGSMTADEFAQLPAVRITDDMRIIANDLKDARIANRDAVTAAPEGDKARALEMESIANEKAMAEAEVKMAESLRIEIGAQRIGTSQELGASVKERAETHSTLAKVQADELDAQLKTTQEQVSAAKEGTKKHSEAVARLAEVEASSKALRVEEVFYKELADEADFGDELDFAVPRGEDDTIPDPMPLKRDDIGEIDEDINVEATDARFADLEAADELSPAAKAEIETAEIIAKIDEAKARSVPTATACIVNTIGGFV